MNGSCDCIGAISMQECQGDLGVRRLGQRQITELLKFAREQGNEV